LLHILKAKDRITLKSVAARNILDSLSISKSIKDIHIEEVGSPWNEKVILLKKRNVYNDVKLCLWTNNTFLSGRIHRLFLYISDALDQDFKYDEKIVPHGTWEHKARETYNHIWGIYVDSRIANMGMENFFDKTLRRNLFIDTQKNLPWPVSNLLFEKLWNKEKYTHNEIIHYANNLDELSGIDNAIELNAFEIEIGRSLTDQTVRKHIDSIASNTIRDIAYNIINFTASHCKGTLMESSYYVIYFMYDQEIFAEILTTKTDGLHVTLFDFNSNIHRTYIVTEDSEEIQAVQQFIKTIYDNIANHSRLKAIKNPYTAPIEK
jgi:hypothetical protein